MSNDDFVEAVKTTKKILDVVGKVTDFLSTGAEEGGGSGGGIQGFLQSKVGKLAEKFGHGDSYFNYAIDSCGNEGQASLVFEIGPDGFSDCFSECIDGFDSKEASFDPAPSELLFDFSSNPEAIEEILDDVGSQMEDDIISMLGDSGEGQG